MTADSLTESTWDVIVIGGGAAGLMACASAIRIGKKILLLEKNTKLGVKILMSGGTRCNITHACDARGIVEAFGAPGRFLHSALASLSPSDVIDVIESEGVATKVEPGGKVFPASNRALDVRDALVRLATCNQFGGDVQVLAGHPCLGINKVGNEFVITTDVGPFKSSSVILTVGGKSYPGCGTTGDGYAWAKKFGHEIVNPVPALTPLTNVDCWTHRLKGITLEDVEIKIRDGIGKPGDSFRKLTKPVLDQHRGGFLFTHFGYSGPTALNVSRVVSKNPDPGNLILECDFAPAINEDAFRQRLLELFSKRPKQSLTNILSEIFQRRFVEHSLQHLKLDSTCKAGEVNKSTIVKLTRHCKRAQFPIDGTFGFKKAEVTAGGVSLAGVHSKTMESKCCPELYFAGEILDLDGPIGGYNFQAAFSTGWLAGQNVP